MLGKHVPAKHDASAKRKHAGLTCLAPLITLGMGHFDRQPFARRASCQLARRAGQAGSLPYGEPSVASPASAESLMRHAFVLLVVLIHTHTALAQAAPKPPEALLPHDCLAYLRYDGYEPHKK